MKYAELLAQLQDKITYDNEIANIIRQYPIETMELFFVEPKLNKRIKLNIAQKKFVETLFFEKQNIYALGSRQLAGKSTISKYATVFAILAYPGITVFYTNLKLKGQGVSFILDVMKIVDTLPPFLKISYKRAAMDNSMLIFENGSTLIVAGAQHETDFADMFKSHTIHILFVDEFPNIKRNRELLSAASPTISAIKELEKEKPVAIVLIGNAIEIKNDANRYAYELWKQSIEGKTDYVPILFYYRDLVDEEIANKVIQEEYQRTGSMRHILVNYECYFLTGEKSFLDDATINAIKVVEPVQSLSLVPEVNPVKLWKPLTEIYNRPIVFALDVATRYGTDYYALVGIDLETLDYLIEWRDKPEAVYVLQLLETLEEYFPNSLFVIERNQGSHLIELLNIEDSKLYKDNKGRVGFFTNSQNRYQILKTLKQVITKKPDFVVSRNLLSELLMLQFTKHNKFEATTEHDDLVMAAAIGVYVIYELQNNINKHTYDIQFTQNTELFDLDAFIDFNREILIRNYKSNITNQMFIIDSQDNFQSKPILPSTFEQPKEDLITKFFNLFMQ